MRICPRPTIFLIPCILAIYMSAVNAASSPSTAQLEILLEKRDIGQTTALPGVTVDIVFPGGDKVVDGTNCDPGSDAAGRLYCFFPCGSKERVWEYKIRYLKIGKFYRTPPRRAFRLLHCAVSPTPVTAVYLHSDVHSNLDRQQREEKARLNEILRAHGPLMEAMTNNPNDVVVLAKLLTESQASTVDTSIVLEFQRVTANLSTLNLELGEHDQANKYQTYSVAATNVMLDQIAQAYQPEPNTNLWVFPSLGTTPGSLNTYYANLKNLNSILATNVKYIPDWVMAQTREDLAVWRGVPLAYEVAEQIGIHFDAYVGIIESR